MKRSNQLIFPSIVALGVCILDQFSKEVAQAAGLPMSFNSGISLSIFQTIPVPAMVLLLMVILLAVFMAFKSIWKENELATGLFFGGSVSNIIDRVFFSAVRDWMPIPFLNVQNNLADWAIFIALVLIIYRYSLKESVK